jgi:hypothetical protein
MKGNPISRATFTDDAEGHPDFAINSTVNGWSYIDGDGSYVYGMQDQSGNSFVWPGSGEPQAYIVFNPANTVPSLGTDPSLAPHGGAKFFASFAAESGPNNDWMISPLLSDPLKVTFWARSYTTAYGADRLKVGYSTTGTAQSNFTFLQPGSYLSLPAAWTKYEYNLPAGTKYVAFNCVSNDSFILMLDDITIETSGLDPVKYNVYRDNTTTPIASNITTTNYTDDTNFDPTADHTWYVEVVCPEGGNSAKVNVTLEACEQPGNCLPATISEPALGTVEGIYINWTYAAKREEITITQSHAPGTTVIGSSGSLSFGVYNRFRPEDLVAVNGGKLNKFVFSPGMGDTQGGVPLHTYTIRIYQGGTWSSTPAERSPGTLIFSQLLDNNELDFETGADNIILLNEVITIDASQELWIGYWCQATGAGGHPALTDVGPRKHELGNVMNYQGWTTLYDAVSNSPYNWYMQGKVQKYTPPPTTVNIYRGGEEIKSNYEGTDYLDTDPSLVPEMLYCYTLIVNCPDGSTSELSNEVCAKKPNAINENAKTTFSILPNPAHNNITVTAGNNFHTIEIVNFLGQNVLSQPNVGNTATLDISSLSNGVYFVRIISEKGTDVKKFVKQ